MFTIHEILLSDELNKLKSESKDEDGFLETEKVISLIIPINTRILKEEVFNQNLNIFSTLKDNKCSDSFSTIKNSSNDKTSNSNEKTNLKQTSNYQNKNKISNFNSNTNINGNVIYENKKRNHLEMMKSSVVSNEIHNQQNNKKFKFPTRSNAISSNVISNIDPEKKIFSKWTVEKLEEELEKLKKNLGDLEKEINLEEKKKRDLEKFTKLRKKWLKISQDAIYKILDIYPQNNNYERNTIKSILSHFKIDKELIEYDSENECFKEL